MNFIFCKLKKPQKTWISFFASLKNVKKHEFHFLQASKAQKTWISFFASLKNLKKKSEHTILVHKEEDEVSNKDILMLTLLGVADGYAPYAPLCGIAYFTHTVYHDYSIYMQIVITIVCNLLFWIFISFISKIFFS